MRIIAGTHRGARIAAPKGLGTRPTGDRVREAAFNLIGPVDGASVLDLFAGSGALGLEALSRGAASVTFVESDRAACRTIAENLEKLKLTGARVVCADAVWTLRQDTRTYDLVLVDAPYETWEELEPKLAEHLPRVLAPDGVLVVETGARTEPSLPLPVRTSRRYGSARLTVFEPHPMITAICPGSAMTPSRFGHVDVIERARRDLRPRRRRRRRQPAAQGARSSASTSASSSCKEALAKLDNVEVDVFSELVVEFARRWEAKVIVKGLRVISDFEWEFQMNQLNRHLAPEIETVYVMASPQVSFVSSSGVKEIAAFGGKVDELVPDTVARRLAEKFPNGRPGAPENPRE